MVAEDPIAMPDDLRSTDRGLLVALSNHQSDRTPLSIDQERLLESWISGRLAPIDEDRAAELVKRNVFAAEHVLECRLISVANEGTDVPPALTERVLGAARSRASKPARLFDLQWPMFHGWQWSKLGALAATMVAITVFGIHLWQQQFRPNQSVEIAMVTLEDRSILAEGTRRTRGLQPEVSSPRTHFLNIDIPTALLQRAISSASNDGGVDVHSEFMNFLQAHNVKYNNRAGIFIDYALADNLGKQLHQGNSTQVRVYDLEDLQAVRIISKARPLPADAHFLFLTIGQ